MRFVLIIIFQIFSNIIAILAASNFIPNFSFTGNFIDLTLASLIFAAINLIIKPIAKIILTPLIIITFGLFIIVINALALHLLDLLSKPLNIQGYIPLLLGTILISVINVLINAGAKIRYRKK